MRGDSGAKTHLISKVNSTKQQRAVSSESCEEGTKAVFVLGEGRPRRKVPGGQYSGPSPPGRCQPQGNLQVLGPGPGTGPPSLPCPPAAQSQAQSPWLGCSSMKGSYSCWAGRCTRPLQHLHGCSRQQRTGAPELCWELPASPSQAAPPDPPIGAERIHAETCM